MTVATVKGNDVVVPVTANDINNGDNDIDNNNNRNDKNADRKINDHIIK